MRLTPLTQLSIGTAAVASVCWLVIASTTVAIDLIAADGAAVQASVLHDAYQARLDALTAERDQRAAEAHSAQSRFLTAMDQISRQQSSLLASVAERRELSTALDLMRLRLQQAVAARDDVAAANVDLLTQMSEVSETLSRSGSADLADTLTAVSKALSDAVAARDSASAERTELAAELAAVELQMAMATRRQDEMLNELEQAIAASSDPLEKLFETSKLDVDSLIATVRQGYSGQGGPEGSVTVSTRSYNDTALSTRFDDMMIDLDRVNLLRIAAGKVPYAMPVKADFRFTSGFGTRSDPKGRGRRMHSGIDLAGPKGTPILATADGVVTSAKNEAGYGNTIRIRHAFGFETVFAHQSVIRVKPGQQISRGDHIGDMGATGRTTGVHLHYEVHLNGQPVNPMTYVEAARHVF